MAPSSNCDSQSCFKFWCVSGRSESCYTIDFDKASNFETVMEPCGWLDYEHDLVLEEIEKQKLTEDHPFLTVGMSRKLPAYECHIIRCYA